MSLLAKSPREQFALQDLSLQCATLCCPQSTPRGVYLLPDETDPLSLHGVLFPPSTGPFSGGVFRFVIHWPGSPNWRVRPREGKHGDLKSIAASVPASASPTVVFTQGLNHPMIHPSTHTLSLTPRFPTWHPRTDTLSHLLYYIRDCFGWKFLEDVKPREGWWVNAEMGRLLRTSTKMFSNLASQSVQLSISSSALYDANAESNASDPSGSTASQRRGITFSKHAELTSLRQAIFGDEGSDGDGYS